MGGCLFRAKSHSHLDSQKRPMANVISVNGELRRFVVPITVSNVLQSEAASSCFVCDSDYLYFDEFIPAMDPAGQLLAGQIYFVLPISRLRNRLRASDMAALAVKASVALDTNAFFSSDRKGKKKTSSSANRRNNNNKCRISPVILETDQISDSDGDVQFEGLKKKSFEDKPAGDRVSNSGSMAVRKNKLQRYSSTRRARMAVRSFRLRLATIYE